MKASRLAAGGLIAGLAGAAMLTFVDTYSGSSCTVDPGIPEECVDSSRTLIEENGRWVLLLFALLLGLAAGVLLAILYHLPIAFEWTFASIAFLSCIIAIFSIGIFFLPMTALLFAAALADRRTPAAT